MIYRHPLSDSYAWTNTITNNLDDTIPPCFKSNCKECRFRFWCVKYND